MQPTDGLEYAADDFVTVRRLHRDGDRRACRAVENEIAGAQIGDVNPDQDQLGGVIVAEFYRGLEGGAGTGFHSIVDDLGKTREVGQ